MAPLSTYLTQVPMVHIYSVIICQANKIGGSQTVPFVLAVFGIYHLLIINIFSRWEKEIHIYMNIIYIYSINDLTEENVKNGH